jgi:hypothetical protein
MMYQGHDSAQPYATQGKIEVRPYTPLQLHFLSRLEQLDRLRDEYEQSSQPDPYLLQLVKKAIYSTLRDCSDQEIGDEARAVLSGQAQGS